MSAWVGWLCCGGDWRPACRGDTLAAAARLLTRAQEAAGCRACLHGALTGGGPPTFPPPAGPCLGRAQVRPPTHRPNRRETP